MKRLKTTISMICCVLFFTVYHCYGLNVKADDDITSEYECIGRNQSVSLYIHRENASVRLINHHGGKEWSSNPITLSGTAYDFDPYSEQASQLKVIYYNQNGERFSMDNYTHSILAGNYNMVRTKNGAKLTFQIGQTQHTQEDIPAKLSDKRFKEKFLENKALDESQQRWVQRRYLFDESKKIWSWKSTDAIMELERMLAIMETVGYTQDDLRADNTQNGVQSAVSDDPVFDISLYYELTDEGFSARVPLDEVGVTGSVFLHSIELLNYFGAASDSEDGYIFVPDGSGALLRFGAKSDAGAWSAPVYGRDATIVSKINQDYSQPVRMPVFGLKTGDDSFLAVIEDGDALATVHANRPNSVVSTNTVYAGFTIRAMDYAYIGTNERESQIPVFQRELYNGSLKIGYYFQHGSDASYAGMASCYRGSLLNNGFSKQKPREELPFVLETVGAITRDKKFLWFNYVGTEKATTFAQDQIILQKLLEFGIKNIALKLSGWTEGNLNPTAADRISANGSLGGLSGFKKVQRYAAENGITIYPDAQPLTMPVGGFKKFSYAARALDQNFAARYAYNAIDGKWIQKGEMTVNPTRHIVSAGKLPAVFDALLKRFSKWNTVGISFGDMGDAIYSDYNTAKNIDRQTVRGIFEEQLQRVSQAIMISGGNSFAARYAGMVTEASMYSSKLSTCDEEVPFYQMVFHGLCGYAGEPFNLTQQPEIEFLHALETGGVVYYKWIYAPSHVMKDTDHNDLYATHFGDTFDDAVNYYRQANTVLADLQDRFITAHEKLADGIYQTSFDGGVKITVNYTGGAFEWDGHTVLSRGYIRTGGDER